MRRLILLALTAIALPCLAAPCDELPKPSVTVKRLSDKLIENSAYGYQTLTHLGTATNHSGHRVLGLTRGNATVRFTIHMPSITDPSGRWECVSPQITLTYGMTPLTLFVAREFPPGSCAHKEIREHEMRHVQAYQQHLAGIEKDITETLVRRFATGAVWHGPAGQTAARLQQELDERWTGYVYREIKGVDSVQAEIDTVEEYERVANACEGEISRKLKASNEKFAKK